MDAVAQALRENEQYEAWRKTLEEALRSREVVLGEDHPDTIQNMIRLGQAYVLEGKPQRGAELFDSALVRLRDAAQSNPPQLAAQLAKIGLLFLDQKLFSLAERYLRECVQIREKELPDNWLLFNTRSMLGASLAGQAEELLESDKGAAEKMFSEAETLLADGYEGMKKRETTIPPVPFAQARIPQAAQRLVDLYTAWGKADEAAKWQAMAENGSVKEAVEEEAKEQ